MPSAAFASAFTAPPPWAPRPPPRHVSLRLPPPRSSSNNGGGGGGDKPTTSWVSPDWLTSLSRSVLGRGNDNSGIPVASAKLDDVQDLLGGALFLPIFKWFREEGPVYRLAVGPRDFVIVSDPAVAKHVLRGYGTRYEKGLVAEVSEFLFGSGFAIAEGALSTDFSEEKDHMKVIWTSELTMKGHMVSIHTAYLVKIRTRYLCNRPTQEFCIGCRIIIKTSTLELSVADNMTSTFDYSHISSLQQHKGSKL